MISDAVVPMFIPAGPELLILFALVILLFGAKKIPELARSSGEAIGEFKRGREELEEELAEEREAKKKSGSPDGSQATSEAISGEEPNR